MIKNLLVFLCFSLFFFGCLSSENPKNENNNEVAIANFKDRAELRYKSRKLMVEQTKTLHPISPISMKNDRKSARNASSLNDELEFNKYSIAVAEFKKCGETNKIDEFARSHGKILNIKYLTDIGMRYSCLHCGHFLEETFLWSCLKEDQNSRKVIFPAFNAIMAPCPECHK